MMRSIKLRNLLLLSFTACMCVLLAIQVLIINTSVEGQQRAEMVQLNERLVQSIADEVGGLLEKYLSMLRVVARNDCFKQPDPAQVQAYLKQINHHVRTVDSSISQPFVFVDKKGVAYYENGAQRSIAKTGYFLRGYTSKSEYTISDPTLSYSEWNKVIYLMYPTCDDDNNRTGYLLSAIPCSEIESTLNDVNVYDYTLWVMGSHGALIAEDANHEHVQGSEVCPQYNGLIQGQAELSQAAFGTLDITGGDKARTLMFCTIPNSMYWKLCILSSNEVVYASIYQMRDLTVTSGIALLVAFTALMVWQLRRVTGPLHTLSEAMENFDPEQASKADITSNCREVQALSDSFNGMSDHIKSLIDCVIKEQGEKRSAELRALQSQINPHFLYNTLDTMAYKAMKYGAAEVSDMIMALSGFFRLSLNDGKDEITLDKEMEYLYNYLFIQQTRYQELLDYDLELESGLEKYKIYKLMLQPLVENALYHGIKPKGARGKILVRIRKQGDELRLYVADDGVGMDGKTLDKLRRAMAGEDPQGAGEFGLRNVSARIRYAYGGRASIHISSSRGRGTIVRIVLPAEEKEE